MTSVLPGLAQGHQAAKQAWRMTTIRMMPFRHDNPEAVARMVNYNILTGRAPISCLSEIAERTSTHQVLDRDSFVKFQHQAGRTNSFPTRQGGNASVTSCNPQFTKLQ